MWNPQPQTSKEDKLNIHNKIRVRRWKTYLVIYRLIVLKKKNHCCPTKITHNLGSWSIKAGKVWTLITYKSCYFYNKI